jgi:hypothetical protein
MRSERKAMFRKNGQDFEKGNAILPAAGQCSDRPLRQAERQTTNPCRQTFRHGGRWLHHTHAGRHSGLQADGYALHMQADIQECRQKDTLFTFRQTFRHAGRWLHMDADDYTLRQLVTHACKHSIIETDGYTWRQMAIQGGRWLHMQADIQAWRQMATHEGRLLYNN